MVDRIRRFQVLNSQIFATLNKYLHTSTVDADNMPVEHVRYVVIICETDCPIFIQDPVQMKINPQRLFSMKSISPSS